MTGPSIVDLTAAARLPDERWRDYVGLIGRISTEWLDPATLYATNLPGSRCIIAHPDAWAEAFRMAPDLLPDEIAAFLWYRALPAEQRDLPAPPLPDIFTRDWLGVPAVPFKAYEGS